MELTYVQTIEFLKIYEVFLKPLKMLLKIIKSKHHTLIHITNLFGKEKYYFIENRVLKDLRALFWMMKIMIMMITCKNKASFK